MKRILLLRFLCFAAFVWAAYYLVLFVIFSALRSHFPYLIEPNEGLILEQLWRIMEGKKLYVEPSLDFIPVTYPPVYYYAGAVSAFFFGPNLFALRFVSILASLCCFVLIFHFVYRPTKDWRAAGLAAGLFAATFSLSIFFMDVARVDTLYVALLLASVYLMRTPRSTRAQCATAALIACAIFTKQTALLVLGPLILFVVLRDRRKALPLVIATAAAILCLGLITAFVAGEGTWSYFYLFEILRHQPQSWKNLFLFHNASLGIAYFFVVVLFVVDFRKRPFSEWGFNLLFLLLVTATAVLGNSKAGGVENHYIQFFAVISIFFGLFVHRFATADLPCLRRGRYAMALAVVVLTLAQFALLRYDLDAPLAEARSYWPNQAFLDLIEKNTGDVLTLHHYNYLRHATGRPMYPHFDSLGWILADRHPASVRFAQSFFEELRSGRFDTIIVSPLIGWFGDGSNFGYVCQTISGNQYPQGRYEIMRTRVFRPARDCKH